VQVLLEQARKALQHRGAFLDRHASPGAPRIEGRRHG
jgi:hypothetical protein